MCKCNGLLLFNAVCYCLLFFKIVLKPFSQFNQEVLFLNNSYKENPTNLQVFAFERLP
jgi:hypothetical protein